MGAQLANQCRHADLLALDVGRLGECEFFLISEMNSHLIVHQPYRTLTSLQSDLFLSQDEIIPEGVGVENVGHDWAYNPSDLHVEPRK